MPRRSALVALLFAAAATCGVAVAADDDAAGCSRERPCANHGSCEQHTGACACPHGFGGRLCETTLLAACALTNTPPPGRPAAMLCASGSGVPEHGLVGLLSCDCLRQCVAHEGGGLATHGPCYERPGGPDAQLSAFPGEEERGVVYRLNSADERSVVTREAYMEHQARENRLSDWEALPLRECNASCSFEGVCLREPGGERKATCWCHYGFGGDGCDAPQPDACLNACAGHGTCIRGFCSCDMGWFGIDCSIDLNATASLGLMDPVVELDMPEGDGELYELRAHAGAGPGARALVVPPGAVQQRLRPAVYVYELPTWLAQAFEIDRLAYQTERGMYAAYWPFFSNLLADGHIRTHDPWKANLFYIPAFTYSVSSNGLPPHDYIRRVLRFIRAEYPALWARRGGRDHMVWAPGDRGVCPLPPDLAQLIWLVHFGLEHATADGGNLPPGADLSNTTLAAASCFDPQRGVVAPPLVSDAAALANATFGPGAVEQERPTLLFFAGGIRMEEPEYSQGVRQQIWTLYRNRTAEGYQIHERVPDMGAEMRRSRFCLAPSGHGWGIRIVHAMATGCVPVVIQDGVHQPYDDVLPYDAFSLRLPQSDVASLDAVLRSVSDAELRLLQAGVRRFHRAFIWEPALPNAAAYPGEAYQWLIKSLHRRLHNILAGF